MTPAEADYVVRNAAGPYPRRIGDGKYLVWGATASGRPLQVVFVRPPDEGIDPESLSASDLVAYSQGEGKVVYVIHAMEMAGRMKRQARRGRRRRRRGGRP